MHQQGTPSRGKGSCIIPPELFHQKRLPEAGCLHDPSPKFAGAGTLPSYSGTRSNLRNNQYALSCRQTGPGARTQSEPAQRSVNIKGAGSALPSHSEARSNLRNNQYALSCQPTGPGARTQSESVERVVNIKGAGSAQDYTLEQSSVIHDRVPGSRESFTTTVK